MKIESMPTTKDGYKFKIDDVIVLEIARSAIPALKVTMPSSVYPINTKEYYRMIREQFDIEKMINDLLNKNNRIKKVVINSEVCRVDDEIVFQTSELEKYKI